MASLWTNKGVYLAMSGQLDLDAASGLKIALMKSSYTPNQDDNFMSAIASAECDASGYTGGFGGAGRKALSSKTVTEDDANNRVVFDAADPSAWTLAAGNTLRHSVIVLEVTNDTDSPVVCANDFGSDFVTNGGDLSLAFSSSGIGYTST